MAEQVMFEGEEVKLGNRKLIVPSLSMKQARELWPAILEMDRGITKTNLPDKQSQWMDIISAAISRNYPDITRDELEGLVDLRNIRKLMLVVMGESALPPEKPAVVEEEALPVQ